jgi:nucleoside-diphosphate-sugar epimerase
LRVLVLGGTGTIGGPVLRRLVRSGHEVVALARSAASAARARTGGASLVLAGDIGRPSDWLGRLPAVDAVVHMACDFAGAMAAVERRLLDGLLPRLADRPGRVRFIYTGGCWLFGTTGPDAADEDAPMRPLPAFAWMVPHARRILSDPSVEGVVVHPGMVYGDEAGGVFRRFAAEAARDGSCRVVGDEGVCWPLVHAEDLADLYRLALERAPAGTSYLGVAVEGMPVGRIARAAMRRFGHHAAAPRVVTADAIAAELGEWARGYGMDQRLSGARARDLGWRPAHLDPLAAMGQRL